jgi:hypothetical protein
MKKVYSPNQIAIGTYIGGPLAAMYYLKTNFDLLNKLDLSGKVLAIGGIVTLLLLLALPFIPESLPNQIIPLMYLIPVVMIVKSHQLTKQEIIDSESYEFQSSWKSFGISILGFIAFMLLAFIVLFSADAIGLIDLEA